MTRLKGITVVMGLCALLATSSACAERREGYAYGGYPYYPGDGLFGFDYGDGGRGFEHHGFGDRGEFGEHGGEGEHGGFAEHGGGEHGGFGGHDGGGGQGGGGHR